MSNIQDRLKGITNKPKWAARGASFMTKVRATKAVWFPGEPARRGKKTAAKTKRKTKRTTGRATKRTAKKATKRAS